MKNRHKRKRLAFLSSVFAISLVGLFFVLSNFRDNIVFFYSPSEVADPKILEKIHNRYVRVGGLVKKDSVKKLDALKIEFVVTDLENDLKITYSGLLPDLFREGQGVVAQGKFDEEKGEFLADELLIKHDEKYMPPEVEHSLKKKQ